MFYYSLGENKEEYYRFVKEQLYSASLLPNTIHREMLNLNPVSFITTNYDTLLEDAAIQYCQSFKVVHKMNYIGRGSNSTIGQSTATKYSCKAFLLRLLA